MHPADIQAALKKKGVTQAAIACKLGVSEMTVSRVVRGTDSSRRVAQAISEVIGIPVSTLWPERYGNPKRAAA